MNPEPNVTITMFDRANFSCGDCWLNNMIFDFVPEGIVVTNGKDLIYGNKGLADLTGYAITDLPKVSDLIALTHPDEQVMITERLKLRLEGKIVPSRYEATVVRKDGSERFVEVAVMVARLLPEPRIVATVHDITERKTMENNLKQNYEALKQLDRMKTDFVNAVSHELRTPLTSVLGYAEFLEDEMGGPLTDMQREHVREIQSGAKRLQQLVDDLLDFARIQSGTFGLTKTDVDLSGKLREAINSLRPQAREAKVHLHLDVPSYMLVNVDATRINQAVLNLVANAIKFTPPGGTVRVKAHQFEDAVMVEVRDNGCGMDPETQSKLFTKFFQGDPSMTREHGGVGLGLAIVKEIVHAHGGQVFAESKQGKGSNFWFRIPV